MNKKLLCKSFAVASLVVMSSCTSTQTPSYKDLNGEWNIVEIEGRKIEKAEEQPFFGFNIAEGRLYGSAGCNNLIGGLDTLQLAKGSLSMKQVGMTRRMCADMTVEDQLSKIMPQIETFKFEKENKLILQNADKKAIVTLEKR